MQAVTLLLFVFSYTFIATAVDTISGIYNVGIAAVDISPEYPIRLNGFGGRRKESEGVRQKIWAKALAIGTTDQDTVVVVTVDTLGIPDDMTERIEKRLRTKGTDD